MDKLEIDISPENNTITVKNNGKGIPIEYHQKEKCYVPTLVFGTFLILNTHKYRLYSCCSVQMKEC
jgi:DNA gyrase/topoisomerase IV subunit B